MDSPRTSIAVSRYALTAGDQKRFADELELGLVPANHPALGKTAKLLPVEEIGSQKVQSIIDTLFAAATNQRDSKHAHKRKGRGMVGLAAPQIGVELRIILIDTHITRERKKFGKLECFINPEIIWQTRETEEGREGCFSTGPVWGLVRRSIAIKIRAIGREGKPLERILEGFTARIACHEIDHLNGIRFPDRITKDAKRHWVHAEELEVYPKQMHEWPRICTKERWEGFKKDQKTH